MINHIAFHSLQKVSSTIKSIYNLRIHKLHKFKPKIEIEVEIGPLLLKTVSNTKELKAALELRHEVFYQEMLGTKNVYGIDVDEYDFYCDHLIIIDKKTQNIVGTYRLNCSLFNDDFYSSQEFSIDRLMEQNGIKIELGRACIHQNYRRGLVISLLWRGIAEYMNACSAQLLFGCASIKTTSPKSAALLYRYFFEDNRFNPEYFCPPTLSYKMPQLDLWIQNYKNPLTEAEKKEAQSLIPPLFRTYLKIGAYVGGAPALDTEFKCIDFLTILHKEDLNRSLWKKYKLESES